MGQGDKTMPDRNFYIKPTDADGSSCGITTNHHYDNVSQSEAIEAQEAAMRRGDEVIIDDDPADYSSDQRFNLFQTDIDDVGSERQSKHAPGR